MSFPICDRCKTDHNPFTSCPDLQSPQERIEAVKAVLETPNPEKPTKDRKAYMRAYMAQRRLAKRRAG